MPDLNGLHVKVVLGRLGYPSTIDQRVSGWHDEKLNDRLKALDHEYQLAETLNTLREIPIPEYPDDSSSCVRWMGGRCQTCGKKEVDDSRSDCERGGRCNWSEPTRFHVVMVETGGSQISETERRKQRLFQRRGKSPSGSTARTSPQTADDTHIDRIRRSATLPTPQDALVQPGINPVLCLKYGKQNVQRVLDQSKEALCLTVRLEKRSFPLHPFAMIKTLLDIKVDVYCNGEFMTSSFMSLRGKKGDSVELCLRFHGKRVSKNGEMPLIATPSREPLNHEEGEAAPRTNSRWDEISEQIRLEAEGQAYACEGSKSELGKYLQDLAELKLPQQIIKRQAKSGPVFGVLDVVVSVGSGRKYGPQAGYSEEPIQMNLSKLKNNQKPWADLLETGFENLQLNSIQPVLNTPDRMSLKQTSGILTTAGKDLLKRTRADEKVPEPAPKRSRLGQDLRGPAGKRSIAEVLVGSTPLPIGRTHPSHTTDPNAVTSGRRAGRYSYVTVAKHPTQEEEFKRLQKEARDAACRLTRERDAIQSPQSTHKSPRPTPGAQSTSHDLTRPSHSSPRARRPGNQSQRAETTTSPLSSIASTSSQQAGSPSTLGQQEHISSSIVDGPAAELSLRGGGSERDAFSPDLDHGNSVLSYAPEGKLRQVRTERDGEFAESSILFGVRYVVF